MIKINNEQHPTVFIIKKTIDRQVKDNKQFPIRNTDSAHSVQI